jgi:hypothetical protein
MEIQPLKKEIYDKAVAAGIKQIMLNFSGGNDEGCLYISTYPDYNSAIAGEVESWAWEVYEYSGAGDGSEYGDEITYDLVNKKASSQEWYTSRVDGDYDSDDLVIDENEKS